MIIKRFWSMPNHETFKIPYIKQILKDELNNEYLDPFPYPFETDGLKLLKETKSNSIKNLVFDPPYSQRQLKEVYKNIGFSYDMNCSYWSNCKNEIKRIIKKNGKVLSFAWNSTGIGKTRGFEIKKIWLICHGGMHNDTIITLEEKITP